MSSGLTWTCDDAERNRCRPIPDARLPTDDLANSATGFYSTRAACEADPLCQPVRPTRWRCAQRSNSTCVPDPHGTFATRIDCLRSGSCNPRQWCDQSPSVGLPNMGADLAYRPSAASVIDRVPRRYNFDMPSYGLPIYPESVPQRVNPYIEYNTDPIMSWPFLGVYFRAGPLRNWVDRAQPNYHVTHIQTKHKGKVHVPKKT